MLFQLVKLASELLLAPDVLGPADGPSEASEDGDDAAEAAAAVLFSADCSCSTKSPEPRSVVCVPVVCVCGSTVCEAVDSTWMVAFLAVLSTWSVSITKGLVASRVGPEWDEGWPPPSSLEMGLRGRQMQREPRLVP